MGIQLMLIQTFGWSLAEIDRTDAVSLFDFIRQVANKGGEHRQGKRLFAEDVW